MAATSNALEAGAGDNQGGTDAKFPLRLHNVAENFCIYTDLTGLTYGTVLNCDLPARNRTAKSGLRSAVHSTSHRLCRNSAVVFIPPAHGFPTAHMGRCVSGLGCADAVLFPALFATCLLFPWSARRRWPRMRTKQSRRKARCAEVGQPVDKRSSSGAGGLRRCRLATGGDSAGSEHALSTLTRMITTDNKPKVLAQRLLAQPVPPEPQRSSQHRRSHRCPRRCRCGAQVLRTQNPRSAASKSPFTRPDGTDRFNGGNAAVRKVRVLMKKP